MSRKGRPLTPDEADLWARVARTVVPMDDRRAVPFDMSPAAPPARTGASGKQSALPKAAMLPAPVPGRPQTTRTVRQMRHSGLDASWDRKLDRGVSEPDFTLDLHGCSLDAAYSRLMHGLTQAKGMGARLVLLITGKERPAQAADRAEQRGAIRRKVIDWLAASEHAADIAAIRGAHRRHGGQGALYIVIRRSR